MPFPSTIFEDIGVSKRSFANALTIVSTASTAATCAEAPAELNIIAVGTTTTGGYRLPTVTNPGLTVEFVNNSGTICTIYPPTGGVLNALAADTGITIAAAAGSNKRFVQTGTALAWAALQIA